MNETSAEALFGILLVGDVMSLYEFLSNRQASFSFYLYCTELRSAVSGPPRPTIPQDAYDSVGAGMSRLESHLKSLETQPFATASTWHTRLASHLIQETQTCCTSSCLQCQRRDATCGLEGLEGNDRTKMNYID